MLYWILFIFALFLLWVENYKFPKNAAELPPILAGPPAALVFPIRIICQYGSITGIFFKYGWGTAVVAFGAGYLFNKITFRIYFNKKIKSMIPMFINLLKTEHKEELINLSEEEIRQVAKKQAETFLENQKKGSF